MKLTERQERFAIAVAREGKTQADAYREHYKCDGWPALRVAKVASALALSASVSARIAELTAAKQKTAERAFDITVTKLLQTFFEIAFTDPNELITVRAGACRHCWGLGGAYQWKEHEYLAVLAKFQKQHTQWLALSPSKRPDEPELPDGSGGFGFRFTADPNPECIECEGEGVTRIVPKDTTKLSAGAKHLYRGAQQTKDGIKILFADKDASLDKIGRILGAYDDRLRVDLKGAVASLQLTTSDPVQAADEYRKMLGG